MAGPASWATSSSPWFAWPTALVWIWRRPLTARSASTARGSPSVTTQDRGGSGGGTRGAGYGGEPAPGDRDGDLPGARCKRRGRLLLALAPLRPDAARGCGPRRSRRAPRGTAEDRRPGGGHRDRPLPPGFARAAPGRGRREARSPFHPRKQRGVLDP